MVHLEDVHGRVLCGGTDGEVTRCPKRCTCHECMFVLHRDRRDRVLAARAQDEINHILSVRKKKQEERVLRYKRLHARP